MALSLLSTIAGLTLAASTAAESAAVPAGKAAPVGYRADSCRLVPRGGERVLSCKGHVKLWRTDLSLSCETLEATFAKDGSLRTAACSGTVEIVSAAGGVARGQHARFEASTQTVELSGKPVAIQQGATVRGQVIRLDVSSGILSVEGASGRIDAQALPSVPAAPTGGQP